MGWVTADVVKIELEGYIIIGISPRVVWIRMQVSELWMDELRHHIGEGKQMHRTCPHCSTEYRITRSACPRCWTANGFRPTVLIAKGFVLVIACVAIWLAIYFCTRQDFSPVDPGIHPFSTPEPPPRPDPRFGERP